MENKKLILFDLGDVIWDECLAIEYIKSQALYSLINLGYKFTEEEWDFAYCTAARHPYKNHNRTYSTIYILVNNVMIVDYILRCINIDLSNMTVERFADLHPLRNNIKEILLFLGNNYLLGIASNQSLVGKSLFNKYQLGMYFNYIFLSCDINIKKPEMGFFEYILNKTSISSKSILMIGNRKDLDIEPAQKCGMKTIHYLCPNSIIDESQYDKNVIPDFTVKNLEELKDIIVNEF